jgi:cysteinyl-tRNA synthetase
MAAHHILKGLKYVVDTAKFNEAEDKEVRALCEACTEHINDDFNTAQIMARLFELAAKVYSYKNEQLPIASISAETFTLLQKTFADFIGTILGLKDESVASNEKTDELVELLINIRKEAKDKKDFATSDRVRNELSRIGIQLKDGKEGTSWSVE